MMLENHSRESQEAFRVAQARALESGHPSLDVAHILWALLVPDESLARSVLVSCGVAVAAVRREVEEILARSPRVRGEFQVLLGDSAAAVLEHSEEIAEELDQRPVHVDHVLASILELAPRTEAVALLTNRGVTARQVRSSARKLRVGRAIDSDDASDAADVLSDYGRDLVAAARRGELDPVIGRDEEIRRLVRILSRRTKNNPVLIGEPGVGKTAIVEGLAQRIVRRDVPEGLLDKSIFSLDLGALIAGTKYRGEFEARLKAVLEAVQDSRGQTLLFIDEIHNIVGAGRSEGAIDAGNMLKPLLARGAVRCIGATTIDEHRKHFEQDAALERRFQPVLVDPPLVEDAISILRGLQQRLEMHHGVRIHDGALVAAAVLSDRYISGRFLPDKAIDLIDEAAAAVRTEIDSQPRDLDSLSRRQLQLEVEREALSRETDPASATRLGTIQRELLELEPRIADLRARWDREKSSLATIRTLREQIDGTRVAIDDAEREYDLNRAAELKYGRLLELEKQLVDAETAARSTPEDRRLVKEEVTAEEVAETLARWTGIPVTRLLESEKDKLLNLEHTLHQRVVAQNDAVRAVTDAVLRARSGVRDTRRPIGSLVFVGPSGVGKTELAKALAAALFDSEDSLIRLDMSEFVEKQSVARLIGAPPGYVGYDEGGQLTEAVRRKPYAVILLDEIDKAHRDIVSVLLQVLDDGRLTDGRGRTIDFRNTVIIMTTNVGSARLLEGADADGVVPPAVREDVQRALRRSFRPEFLNRLDETVVFGPLSASDVRQIARLQLAELETRLEERCLTLQVDEEALERIVACSYDPVHGARPVKRYIQREVETGLGRLLVASAPADHTRIRISADTEGLRFLEEA